MLSQVEHAARDSFIEGIAAITITACDPYQPIELMNQLTLVVHCRSTKSGSLCI